MSKPLKTPDEVATERFNLIAPVVSDCLDKGKRSDLMREISESSGLSVRTLMRYVSAWKEGGYDALKPKRGWERPDSSHGGGFSDIVDAAIGLRRESPSRSVADIIKILELEEAIEPGSVPRSTLQRHMAARGYAASQMRMYISKGTAARRFKKEHRGQLWQGDIKYGPFVPVGKGKNKQIYLVVWMDDATKFIVNARFYMEQTADSVEDSLRRAIQSYGIPDKVYVDNGKQYRSKQLSEACAKLGIRVLFAKPYHPEGKGLVENFNKQIAKLISEAALKKLANIDEYNEYLRIWVEEYYHKHLHSGIGGISPAVAFGTDTRPLKFVSAERLKDAFLHTDTRKVDKSGCISFGGDPYEVGVAYIGKTVTIRFDPSWTEEIEVLDEQAKPFIAKKLVIGTNCGTVQELPEHMRNATAGGGTPPETSRMLDALKKEYLKNHRPSDTATSFRDFWEGGAANV